MSYPQQQYGAPVQQQVPPAYGQPPAYGPQPPMGMPPQGFVQPPPKKSSLPTIAGVFLLLGALNAMIIGGLVLVSAGIAAGAEPPTGTATHDAWSKAVSAIGVCGAMFVMAFIFGLLAAIFCFKRQKWMLAFIMNILAFMFPLIGPFSWVFAFGGEGAGATAVTAVLGFLLGGGLLFLLGLILLLISKKHFEEPPKPVAQPQFGTPQSGPLPMGPDPYAQTPPQDPYAQPPAYGPPPAY